MKIRIISSVLGIPLLLFLVIYGEIPLLLASIIVSNMGLYEFYKAFKIEKTLLAYIAYIFSFIYTLNIYYSSGTYSEFIIVSLLFIQFICIIILYKNYNILDIGKILLGYVYICLFFSKIIMTRNLDNGLYISWLIFIMAWGTDTGAYFTGISIGKHKLCKNLSPNKTIEGSLGGILTAGILCGMYAYIMVKYFKVDIDYFVVKSIFIAIFGSALAQLGDLTASSIKRFNEIKDFGYIMPGHGGMLDRFDSILFTAPFVYYSFLFFS